MRDHSAAWLWTLTVLFAARVLGQALQYWMPVPFLPAFDEFQGSRLPYGFLLATQLLILGLMICTAGRIQSRRLVPRSGVGRLLWWAGWIYFSGSAARVAAGLAMPDAHPWFRAWIPAMFHLVLAAFVLLVACYHLRASAAVGNQTDLT
ncbi:MAG: hypothetical protein AB7E73_14255 [Burkholderiales bacterium]